MIIGLDVGGTHTDVVLLGDEGLIRKVKVPTDAADLFNTVLSGLTDIAAGIDPDQIRRIVMSTTLTTNAIVQKKVPEVGMLVSAGPGIDPRSFQPNAHFFPVSGSIDHRGREIAPIDETEINSIAKILEKRDIRYAGVVGKFSVRNPTHELGIKKLIQRSFDKVLMGHQLSGNLDFPRRIATTYLNTAVFPIHREFYAAVKKSLEARGLTVPIHILKADGGTMNFDFSIDFPGQTILSGPAASLMGSIVFAPDDAAVIVLDIGGTTTDIGVLIKRSPVLEPLGVRLGEYRTLIRSLKTRSIGLGGDSMINVKNGEIEIGPERKGPAMAFGGQDPTPTDALCVMGRITGGDRDRAVQGLERVARQLGRSSDETARKIYDQVSRKIVYETEQLVERINSQPVYTVQEVWEGEKIEPKKILVLGGPAVHFAPRIEEITGFSTRAVPNFEVANAIGAALARTTCEVTLLADTERKQVVAPEENYSEAIKGDFRKQDALDRAACLLEKKASRTGADTNDLQMEVLEELEFKMVRGFNTTGRNIRVKVQAKPGLIGKSEAIIAGLQRRSDH